MNTPDTLLAATDFSAPSRHAAERAALLAGESGARLLLIHAVAAGLLADLRGLLGGADDGERRLLDDAQAQLRALAAQLGDGSGPQVSTELCSGNVLDELLRAGDAHDARLLVVGARGSGFLRRLVLGTTAERLLRRARRPVLVVRQKAHETYRRALVPVDFSAWSLPAIALARCVAPQARLVLLHVVRVPFEDKLHFAGVDPGVIEQYRRQHRAEAGQRLEALARDAGLPAGSWATCLAEGDASLRIAEQEQEQDSDLIVIGKHGRSAAEDLLLGSVTKHVLAEGQADVLVSTGSAG